MAATCGLGIGLLGWAPSAASFDLSRSSVPQDEIHSGGPPKDGIPALTDPAVVAAEDATFLQPGDLVLGVVIDGQARAYPIRILNWHEVVNDELADLPIVVTYCPLCGTGMVFRATDQGERVLFGVSGLLYNSDVLLYDRATDSLWSQLKMEAVTGERLGDRLEWLPVQHTTWETWRDRHPATEVLSLQTGYTRDYGRDPYRGYAAESELLFPVAHRDARLPTKAWVLGLLINGQAKAYPVDRLARERIVEDTVAGESIRVEYDGPTRLVTVTGADQRELPAVQVYWFAWAAFYPNTQLYGAE